MLPPPIGQRPVLLVSRDEAYTVRALVMVAEVATRVRRIAAEVPLGPAEGLSHACVANLDNITTIPKSSLRQYVGSLGPPKVAQMDDALRFALGLA
jgi:mRNA interferase MazF